MAWMVVPNLVELREQMDARFPRRSRRSDGTIGDTAHQTAASSHNPDRTGWPEWRDGDALDEVRAADIDADLRDEHGVTMEHVVAHIIRLARAGVLWWIRYVIYNGRIWHKSDGYQTRVYTGSNDHSSHAHINSDYTQAADTVTGTDWRLADIGGDMALSKGDLREIRTQMALGMYDALWVAVNGRDLPDGRLTYSGPGSIGASIRANLRALTSGEHSDAILAEIRAQGEQTRAAMAGIRDAILAELPDDDGPVSREDLEAALRSVLGAVDGATPAQE